MSRVCDSIWAADGSIPPTATHGPALPRRPALRSIVALPWGRQIQDIGFSETDKAAARRAYAAWEQRMESTPPASDCAADALEPEGEWNAYLQAISGFMNGAGLEQTSVADYTAYDAASTGYNWRTQLDTEQLSPPVSLTQSTCACRRRSSPSS